MYPIIFIINCRYRVLLFTSIKRSFHEMRRIGLAKKSRRHSQAEAIQNDIVTSLRSIKLRAYHPHCG